MTRPLIVWVQSLFSPTGYMEDYGYRYTVSDDSVIYDNYEHRALDQKIKSKSYPYYSVTLISEDGKEHNRLVHRIVATTYPEICGDINEVVNHLDECKTNNIATNLQWTTYKMNLEYGTAKERAKINYKEAMIKHKEAQVYRRPQLISI